MKGIWAVPIITSILILGTLGLTDAFAQKGPPANAGPQGGPVADLQTQIDSFFEIITNITSLFDVDSFFDVFTELISTDEDLQSQIDDIELLPGPQGEPGADGQDGAPGANGDDCTIDGTIVTCGDTSSDVQGPTGATGADGATGPAGVPCDDCVDSSSIAEGTIQLSDLSAEIRLLLGVCPNANSLGFVYEGQVTSVNDNGNLLNGGISVGDAIRGFYCYDPNTPDTFQSVVDTGAYALELHTIKIGNHDFSCDSQQIQLKIVNSGVDDRYEALCGFMTSLSFDFSVSVGLLQLRDSDQTIFVDDSLPQSAPDLNEFESKNFNYSFTDFGPFGVVSGTITSLVQVQ